MTTHYKYRRFEFEPPRASMEYKTELPPSYQDGDNLILFFVSVIKVHRKFKVYHFDADALRPVMAKGEFWYTIPDAYKMLKDPSTHPNWKMVGEPSLLHPPQ